jgi:large subunit ribosomal protein L25
MSSTTTDSLNAVSRDGIGTTAVKRLREEGLTPAVLFGHGAPPLPLALEAKAFLDLMKHSGGKNRLLSLTIDGKGGETALVREVQRDPVTRRIVHVDLQRVGAAEQISASLPIIALGVAEGVKSGAGVMDIVVHALQVRGPANAIPENVEIDVSHLGVHGHVTAGDVKLAEGLTLDVDPLLTLISIEPLRAAEVEPTTEAAAVPTVAETSGGGSAS